MHAGYYVISKMAAVFVRNVRSLRTFPLLSQKQQNCLSICLSKELRDGTRSVVVLSVRAFSSSSSEKSPSNEGNEEGSKDTDKPAKVPFDLSFAEYQKLKRKIRSRQRIAGLPIAAVALVTSSAVSAYLNPNMFDAAPDQIQPIMGMDPLIFCGLCGVASAGVGYVVGSALFGSLWKIFNKDISTKMEKREADFLRRITAKRAATFSKFEDDYYGESIKTLSDYRQWLREQEKKKKAAESFEKKSEKGEEEQERTAEVH